MSEWPSLLKSPVPISVQLGPGLGLTAPPPTRLPAFISQIEAWPSVFCQKISKTFPAGGVVVATTEFDAKIVLSVVASKIPRLSVSLPGEDPPTYSTSAEGDASSGVLSGYFSPFSV